MFKQEVQGTVMTPLPHAAPRYDATSPARAAIRTADRAETASSTKRAKSFEREALPHLTAVFRFALRLTGSTADAEDLVQETYLRAYRSWHRYELGTRAKSWLFTICRNAFLRQRQLDSRRDKVMSKAANSSGSRNPGHETALFMTSNQQDPENWFFSSATTNEVVAMIDRLPAEFRQVVLLSDLEDLRYAEIAERLAVPIGTVKSRLFRGRRLLQERLYPYALESGVVRKPDAAANARTS